MTKLTKKIALTSLFSIMILALFAVMTFAGSAVSGFNTEKSFEGAEKAKGFINNILSLIKMIAVAIALGMLLFIGIKYVSAGPDEKAKLKEHAITYLIGAVCIFSAVGILSAIEAISKGLNNVNA